MAELLDRDAFQEGHDAYRQGLARKANPYPTDTAARADWENGWGQARLCDLDEDVFDLTRRRLTAVKSMVLGAR